MQIILCMYVGQSSHEILLTIRCSNMSNQVVLIYTQWSVYNPDLKQYFFRVLAVVCDYRRIEVEDDKRNWQILLSNLKSVWTVKVKTHQNDVWEGSFFIKVLINSNMSNVLNQNGSGLEQQVIPFLYTLLLLNNINLIFCINTKGSWHTY